MDAVLGVIGVVAGIAFVGWYFWDKAKGVATIARQFQSKPADTDRRIDIDTDEGD